MPRSTKRLRAKFLEDDPRYAEVNGEVLPVLLTSFDTGFGYEEDVQDIDEYPERWAWQFHLDLKRLGKAALASDSNLDDNWRFLGVHAVSAVRLSNFLTCRIGKKLASLNLE